MNLSNIHFHKNAEHKGGEFNLYAGNGDGYSYQSGYKYSGKLTQHGIKNGLHQALNIPDNTGKAVQYAGSTTGPGYNEKGSPYQVSCFQRYSDIFC